MSLDAGPGVIIRDANKIINREEIFYFANPATNEPNIAPFSDLFRFKLLHEIGGWWCDVDTICLSDSIPDWEYAWTRDAPEAFPASVGSAIIAFPKNDPVIQELYNRCHNLSVNFTDRDDLGPNLISYVLGELGLPLDMSVEPDMFYSLRWIENFKFWLPEFREEIESKSVSAVFTPIFASFAKNVGIDFTRLPPTGCFLDTIFETYNPDLQSTRTRYDCGVIKDLTKCLTEKGLSDFSEL